MQLDKLAADPQPLWVPFRQLGQEHEEPPRVPAIAHRVLDPDRAGQLLGRAFVDLLRYQPGYRQDLIGIGKRLPPGGRCRHRLELLGQGDLNFPRHADLDE